MTKKHYLQGVSWDSLLLAFVRILTILSSIILTKMLSSGLSLEAYGTYSQVNIVTAIGTSLILLGLGDAINYYYNSHAHGADTQARLCAVNTIFLIEIVLGALLAIAIILGRGMLSAYFSNPLLQPLLIIFSAKPLLDNLLYFYQLLYVSAGKAKVIAIRNLVVTVLKISATYIAVYLLKDLMWILLSLLLLDLLQLLFFTLYLKKAGLVISPFKGSLSNVSKILAYSLPMGIYALTSTCSRELDKLVIGYVMDTEALAIYANCSKLLPLDIISVSFATVLIPFIMRYVSGNRTKESSALFRNYLKIGYYSVWTLGTAILITSTQVISFLYTDTYLKGTSIFIIYIFDSMLRFASMHLVLTAGGKSKTIMVYSIITLVLNLLLNITFLQLFGIAGPAIATLLTTGIYTFLILRKTRILIGANWADIVSLSDILVFALILLVVGSVFYIVNQTLLAHSVNRFLAMIISAGGFCLSVLLINRSRIISVVRAVNTLRT